MSYLACNIEKEGHQCYNKGRRQSIKPYGGGGILLHIVLVHPEIPQNTGNIARTCAVTGAALHLVRPMSFEIDDKKLKRAGLDYWDKLDVRYHDSFEEVARIAPRMWLCTTKASERHSDVCYQDGDYFVFGRETAGLGEEILSRYPQNHIRIPMRNELRSLNLSNAAAIIVYEALRQIDFPDMH